MAGQYGGGSTGGRTDFFTNLPAQNQDELEKTINESVKKLKEDLTSQLEKLNNKD